MHSTNYANAFIEVAEDCPTSVGEIPPTKGSKKSVANLQFEMIVDRPYQFTSDDVLFSVWATRKGIPDGGLAEAREIYFSKGQPCFRASPLTKRYGWGVHSDAEGRIAIYGVDSDEYAGFVADESLKKVKAMRSKRK